ncbi:uncharacterized protein LOC132048972 [Lycium ferocissimum]|uniref:uncharacterized protein LOC132048972 n=1 Tax=Lycium ferocissimum TaxID=112874 RepID=UPI0028151FCD|nr:uncharacterized protein LOC132048972 [Lycium ferocissimum]
MQRDLNGLKILIQKESKGAHSIHCFAHQLQLTLVAISRRCDEVQEFSSLVSDILNMVGAFFKLRDEFFESQAKEIGEALCKGELETGRGLNQVLGLARAGDTRWGSHYKSFKNFILMFGPIIDVLDAIAINAHFEEMCRTKGYLKARLTFEVVFMRTVLAITNELHAAFQKKEQDISNAMLLVRVAKEGLQELRDEVNSHGYKAATVHCVQGQQCCSGLKVKHKTSCFHLTSDVSLVYKPHVPRSYVSLEKPNFTILKSSRHKVLQVPPSAKLQQTTGPTPYK